MSKIIPMPLPAEAAGGQAVKVAQKSPDFVSKSVAESFLMLFAQTESVKCIQVKTNGVLNLQFIGNGCVANMQVYEVRSDKALEQYKPHKPLRRSIKAKKGGAI